MGKLANLFFFFLIKNLLIKLTFFFFFFSIKNKNNLKRKLSFILKMMIILTIIFLFLKSTFGQSSTTNGCFYTQDRFVVNATEITRISLAGTLVQKNLATCCDMCRALPDCVAWDWYSNNCVFFKDIESFGKNNGQSFSGLSVNSKIWRCDEKKDKYYFGDDLNWILQIDIKTSTSCCDDCFYSRKCKSWMFMQASRICYHSNENYENAVNFVNMSGLLTGTIRLPNKL